MATNPQGLTAQQMSEAAERARDRRYANAQDVASMNRISVDEARARIDRATASQSGELRTPEGVYYNPDVGRYSTDITTIGRDPNYWPGASMGYSSPTIAGAYSSGMGVAASPSSGSRGQGVGMGMGTTDASGRATIGSIYGSGSISGTGAVGDYQRYLASMSAPVDENKIRQDAINRVQSEIDAMNRFYAEKTRQEQAQAQQVGESRLGQNAAINARRGMIGSDFGAARTSTIEQANAKVQNDIWELNNAQRLQQQAAIMGRANSAADALIEKKQAQLEESLKSALTLQQSLYAQAEKRADTRLAGLIAQGTQPSDADFEALAKELGLDVPTLKAKYATTAAAEKNKTVEVGGVLYQRQADGTYKALTPGKAAEAKGLMEVSPGASLYDPATGKFIGTAPGRVETGAPDIKNFTDGTTRQYNAKTGQWDILSREAEGVGAPKKTTEIVEVGGRNVLLDKQTGDVVKDLGQKTASAPKSAEMLKLQANVQSGLDSLKVLKDAEESFWNKSLPLGIGRQTFIGGGAYEAAKTNLVDIVGRLRSGGAISKDEGERFESLLPSPFDRDATAKYKLDQIEKLLKNINATSADAQVVQPPEQRAESIVGRKLSQEEKTSLQEAINSYPGLSIDQIVNVLDFSPVGSDTKPAAPVSRKFNEKVDKLAMAIAQHETGNRNISGATGELATRYQFMPKTWRNLAGKYLGDPNAPTTDANQDLVAKNYIQDLFNQGYNEREIAMIWNGGVPRRKVGTTKTTSGKTISYDTGKYADSVLAKYNS